MNLKSTTKALLMGMILTGSMQSCSQMAEMEDIEKNLPQNGEGQEEVMPEIPQVPLDKSDSLALVAIYNALDGKNWSRGNNWLKRPVRYWQGVGTKLIDDKLRVITLRLGSMHLNGQLPSEIKNLTELTALEMCYNSKLKGDIIEEVYELKNLITINFRFTAITGELSPSIGKLVQLDTLDLWTSKWQLDTPGWDSNTDVMTGTLPKEIGNLKKLRFMRLGRQAFTGNLPVEIGEMESLNFLDIAQCQFTGGIPQSMGNLKNLMVFYASENKLTNPIPSELGDAENLKELFLFDNQITGEIPNELTKLKNLTDLSLENNKLTGTIPDLSPLSELGILYLQNNQLSGSIPASIGGGQHSRLICADLSNNNLTGSVPSRSSHSWNGGGWYTQMILKGNRLTGTIDQSHLKFEAETRKRFLPQQEGYGFDNLK